MKTKHILLCLHLVLGLNLNCSSQNISLISLISLRNDYDDEHILDKKLLELNGQVKKVKYKGDFRSGSTYRYFNEKGFLTKYSDKDKKGKVAYDKYKSVNDKLILEGYIEDGEYYWSKSIIEYNKNSYPTNYEMNQHGVLFANRKQFQYSKQILVLEYDINNKITKKDIFLGNEKGKQVKTASYYYKYNSEGFIQEEKFVGYELLSKNIYKEIKITYHYSLEKKIENIDITIFELKRDTRNYKLNCVSGGGEAHCYSYSKENKVYDGNISILFDKKGNWVLAFVYASDRRRKIWYY